MEVFTSLYYREMGGSEQKLVIKLQKYTIFGITIPQYNIRIFSGDVMCCTSSTKKQDIDGTISTGHINNYCLLH